MADGALRTPSGIRELRLSDLWLLCNKMRADEIEQYMAFHPGEDFFFEEAVMVFGNKTGYKFALADKEDHPIIAGGYEQVAPGVWGSWMVGTQEGWGAHWREITKASLWMIQRIFADGGRRVQTNALASRKQACEWYIRSLKMRPEGTWRGFGKNGEDVVCFARLKDD